MPPPLSLDRAIERVLREEWGRILAALVKSLGDFQLAEDCLQEAILSAMAHWQRNGLPKSPAAWLITTARRKAIDRLRRDKRFAEKQSEIAYLMELDAQRESLDEDELIPDKRLEMIFTCCHPALEPKTQVALTLRTLGGLSTEEIAKAFLDSPEAMQQRLTRAKKKIAKAGIPYVVPEKDALPDRRDTVLGTIYLIFNEGYAAAKGVHLLRSDLADEAIRLGRILHLLMPQETEVAGLLALMLLSDARRGARADPEGALIPLDQQDRGRWNRLKIDEGISLLKQILPQNQLGPFQLQAAISAVHAESPSWAETDWQEILALYRLLYEHQPTKVVALNMAVAISYARCPEAALAALQDLRDAGGLERYQPFHAARADVLERAGRHTEASEAYSLAIELSRNAREKQFLEGKRARLLY
ncbi:MAG: RNA polymerase sigma factor [Pseudomonadota bacterium]